MAPGRYASGAWAQVARRPAVHKLREEDVVSLVHHTCIDCKTQSPPTDSNYSLIGLAGWRLSPATKDKPNEWRCPSCWGLHKHRARAQTYRFYPKLDDLRRR